jgi:hypothetical protein
LQQIFAKFAEIKNWLSELVERFSDMQADLDRERKTMMRLWAKREEQICGVAVRRGYGCVEVGRAGSFTHCGS